MTDASERALRYTKQIFYEKGNKNKLLVLNSQRIQKQHILPCFFLMGGTNPYELGVIFVAYKHTSTLQTLQSFGI